MRKNRIKNCAAALMCCAAMSFSVWAAGVTGSIDGNVLSVDFDANGAENSTVIYVMDGKLDPNETVTEQLLRERLVAVGMASGGTAELELPEGTQSGLYTVLLGSRTLGAAKEDRMTYVIKATEEELSVAFVEMAAQPDAESLFDKALEYNNSLYIIDLTGIEDKKPLFFELFGENRPSDADELKEIVTAAASIGGIKNKPSDGIEGILTENSTVIGLDSFAAANIGDVAQTLARLRSNGEKLDTLADIRNAVYKATALTAYNRHENIIDTIKKYNEIFGVNFDYKGYSKASKYELEKLLSVTINDSGEVKPLFEKSVDKLLSEKNQSDSGGGSGSSSGGGGGGGKLIGSGISVIGGREDKPLDSNDEKDIFVDMNGYEWAKAAVEALFENGVVSGSGDGNFEPDRAVRREEFVKMAVIGFKLKSSEKQSKFADAEGGEWYTQYIMSAVEANVVNGISDDMFGTGMSITRQDAAVILRRALSESNTELEKTKSLVDFADYDTVSEYALSSVDYLARCGVINGFEDGTFRPNGILSRAEAAKMIYLCTINV